MSKDAGGSAWHSVAGAALRDYIRFQKTYAPLPCQLAYTTMVDRPTVNFITTVLSPGSKSLDSDPNFKTVEVDGNHRKFQLCRDLIEKIDLDGVPLDPESIALPFLHTNKELVVGTGWDDPEPPDEEREMAEELTLYQFIISVSAPTPEDRILLATLILCNRQPLPNQRQMDKLLSSLGRAADPAREALEWVQKLSFRHPLPP